MSAYEDRGAYTEPPRTERSSFAQRSLRELLSVLTRRTGDLVRQEVALAKAELSEKASQAGAGVAMLAAGALVAFAGLIVLLGAATFALVEFALMAPWLAATIVGGVVLVLGIVLLVVGRGRLKPANLTPSRTARSLKRDSELLKGPGQ